MKGNRFITPTSIFNPQKLWLINATAWTYISICNISYLRRKNLNTNRNSSMMAQQYWSSLWLRRARARVCVCVCVMLTFSHALRKQGAPTDQLRHGELGESALSWERSHTSTTIIISVSSTLRLRSRRLHQASLLQLRGWADSQEELQYHSTFRSPSLIPSLSDCSSRKQVSSWFTRGY